MTTGGPFFRHASRRHGPAAGLGRGDEVALEALIPHVHGELQRIARRCMAASALGTRLQATGLVNEAYLRLIDVQRIQWQDRAHFLSMAARLMRRILVDSRGRGLSEARRRRRPGHLSTASISPRRHQARSGRSRRALAELAKVDERKSHVIELRFFGGLSVEETATVLKVSVDTVMRDWKLAKAWLLRELRAADTNATG